MVRTRPCQLCAVQAIQGIFERSPVESHAPSPPCRDATTDPPFGILACSREVAAQAHHRRPRTSAHCLWRSRRWRGMLYAPTACIMHADASVVRVRRSIPRVRSDQALRRCARPLKKRVDLRGRLAVRNATGHAFLPPPCPSNRQSERWLRQCRAVDGMPVARCQWQGTPEAL